MSYYNLTAGLAWVTVIPVDQLPAVMAYLSQATPDYPGGSSFAVTSERGESDYRKVYLSDASKRRMEKYPLTLNVHIVDKNIGE